MSLSRATQLLIDEATRDLESTCFVHVGLAGSSQWLPIKSISPFRGIAPAVSIVLDDDSVITAHEADLRAIRTSSTPLGSKDR